MRDHFWSICFLCVVWYLNTLAWSSFIGFFQNRAVKDLKLFSETFQWSTDGASGRLMKDLSRLMMAPSRLMVAPSRLTTVHWSTDGSSSRLTIAHWSTDESSSRLTNLLWSTDGGLQSTDVFSLVDWWMASVDWCISPGRLMDLCSLEFFWVSRLINCVSRLMKMCSLDSSESVDWSTVLVDWWKCVLWNSSESVDWPLC